MADRIETDVCVVGAGFAGLTAARRLRAGGKDVVVLEARDRIGGRIWTQTLPDGTPVDRGGAWLGPAHDRAFALAREVGATTYKTYVKGKHLLVDGDRMRRYTGLIPKISPLAVLTIAWNQYRVDRMSKSLPIDAPWDAPRAAEWDRQTVGDWIEHTGIRSQIGRDLFEMAVRGLFTGDLHEVSLLHLYLLVRGHGSLNTLFSIDKGAQENMVDGGLGSIAARVASELGDAVRLRAPVRAIAYDDDRVIVTSDDLVVHARRAVVTMPPELLLNVVFEPALPDERLVLYRNAQAGPESKTLVVYDEPFWRADGFSGQTAHPHSPCEVTIDASPSIGTPGVIASFTFGPVAEQYDALDATERRRLVLEALTARLGPRAAKPVEIVETPWWHEEWTRGCSFAHLRPGTLTRSGHLLREPMGRVHWAGTETSIVSHGAVDGAIRSGERAAAEVLDA
ncbi:MAG TPA: FAD-dependent oxidoreductase [Acidimicrobiia bacterium]|nr:FAD-dependent oxidoreductase [Acidimicrobiia bacterium]